MRRLWFKKEMAEKLRAGKKTKTTRYKPLNVQEVYAAVCGSRFKSQSFGHLKVNSVIPTTWKQVIRAFWQEEGFETPQAMHDYLIKEKLIRGTTDDEVWTAEFEFWNGFA